jgi:hypothetical protein
VPAEVTHRGTACDAHRRGDLVHRQPAGNHLADRPVEVDLLARLAAFVRCGRVWAKRVDLLSTGACRPFWLGLRYFHRVLCGLGDCSAEFGCVVSVTGTLYEQFTESRKLEKAIRSNLEGLGYGGK